MSSSMKLGSMPTPTPPIPAAKTKSLLQRLRAGTITAATVTPAKTKVKPIGTTKQIKQRQVNRNPGLGAAPPIKQRPKSGFFGNITMSLGMRLKTFIPSPGRVPLHRNDTVAIYDVHQIEERDFKQGIARAGPYHRKVEGMVYVDCDQQMYEGLGVPIEDKTVIDNIRGRAFVSKEWMELGENRVRWGNTVQVPYTPPDPDVEPEPVPEPDVEPEPVPNPDVEPEPVPNPDVEPEPVPEPDVEPEPVPEPDVEPEPVPDPDPVPPVPEPVLPSKLVISPKPSSKPVLPSKPDPKTGALIRISSLPNIREVGTSPRALRKGSLSKPHELETLQKFTREELNQPQGQSTKIIRNFLTGNTRAHEVGELGNLVMAIQDLVDVQPSCARQKLLALEALNKIIEVPLADGIDELGRAYFASCCMMLGDLHFKGIFATVPAGAAGVVGELKLASDIDKALEYYTRASNTWDRRGKAHFQVGKILFDQACETSEKWLRVDLLFAAQQYFENALECSEQGGCPLESARFYLTLLETTDNLKDCDVPLVQKDLEEAVDAGPLLWKFHFAEYLKLCARFLLKDGPSQGKAEALAVEYFRKAEVRSGDQGDLWKQHEEHERILKSKWHRLAVAFLDGASSIEKKSRDTLEDWKNIFESVLDLHLPMIVIMYSKVKAWLTYNKEKDSYDTKQKVQSANDKMNTEKSHFAAQVAAEGWDPSTTDLFVFPPDFKENKYRVKAYRKTPANPYFSASFVPKSSISKKKAPDPSLTRVARAANGTVGMSNNGSVCYFNTSIRMLFSVKSVTAYLDYVLKTRGEHEVKWTQAGLMGNAKAGLTASGRQSKRAMRKERKRVEMFQEILNYYEIFKRESKTGGQISMQETLKLAQCVGARINEFNNEKHLGQEDYKASFQFMSECINIFAYEDIYTYLPAVKVQVGRYCNTRSDHDELKKLVPDATEREALFEDGTEREECGNLIEKQRLTFGSHANFDGLGLVIPVYSEFTDNGIKQVKELSFGEAIQRVFHPSEAEYATCPQCGVEGLVYRAIKLEELPEQLPLIISSTTTVFNHGVATNTHVKTKELPMHIDLKDYLFTEDNYKKNTKAAYTKEFSEDQLKIMVEKCEQQAVVEAATEGKIDLTYNLEFLAIRSGGTKDGSGGHFYAYRKVKGIWHCENDTIITQVGDGGDAAMVTRMQGWVGI